MSALQELLRIMQRLRGPDGCPWDREQTFASIAPYALEEAYEVLDAIERKDFEQLRDELGDLLFQVVFHAQLAAEQGRFDFEDVARGIAAKLIRRHPHVFEDSGRPAAPGAPALPTSASAQSNAWETIKAQERAERAAQGRDPGEPGIPSALEGVPVTLPALTRAHKLSKRAARVGFDWQDPAQTAEKVAEELAEVRAVVSAASGVDRQAVVEEVGDLLFAAANLARKLEVDAESALRAANAKFERRFRAMEELAREQGLDFATLPLDAQERLWLDVKRRE